MPPAGRLILRTAAIASAAALVGLLAYGLASQAPDRTVQDALSRGETSPAPDFELEVLDGGDVPSALEPVLGPAAADGRIALSELSGTPVVVNLWASWCDPCRTEAPDLEAAWRRHGERGVVLLGVDQQDARDSAQAFIDEFAITYPNVRESGREVARAFGATGLPETFFITERGEIAAHVIGAVNEDQLARGIEAARTGRAVSLGAGGARREGP